MIKKIGLLTSGGDSPGMNACIRAVVRTAVYNNIEVIGFLKGYEGLIDNVFVELKRESVSGIIQKGGTILKTARSERFWKEEGRMQAAKNLEKNNVDGLVIIGGDGSFQGAIELSKLIAIPIVGCAGTIDNDLVGTDFTIGYDTAINTVIDALDKIRDTADSHDRVFVIEVMGKDAGLIALRTAIASGAEALLVPELKNDSASLISKMKQWRSTKSSKIIVVAEGDQSGGAFKVAETITTNYPEFDVRVSILGHIQRGGNPTCMERVNASLVGFNAVKALMNGHKNEMIGIINKQVAYTPFAKAVKHNLKLNKDLEELIEILSS
ncbi:MAG: 6-phosphofructokinase [Bacteroidota bacterium]|nr:6-phosphofructokinase [Bacteroidota bacterium]MDP3144774.1 6-phosphofructokinase [Bacteroidota bacterium]